MALVTVFALSTQDATLIAAGIAAAASVLKLVVDAISARGAAMRAAHRSILEPHLAPLGQEIHEILAGAVIVHRRAKRGAAPGESQLNAKRAAASLKERRLLLKYSLNRLHEPLRILTRTPDWVANYKGDTSGDVLIEQMQDLSKRLDAVISRSYRRGRPPSWVERRRLLREAKNVRGTWERRFGREPDTS